MQISWYGYSAFRLQNDGTTLLTNPYDPGSKVAIAKQPADIVVSNYDGSEVAAAVSGKPFIITRPGEYEVKSIFVYGVPAGNSAIYLITVDDISVAFIGALKLKELSQPQLEVLEGADILIVPVGGGSVMSAKEAVQIINQIEPRIVIPSQFKIGGSKGLESMDVFLKEYSAPREEIEKLKINKKDLMQEDTRVVILKH